MGGGIFFKGGPYLALFLVFSLSLLFRVARANDSLDEIYVLSHR